MRVKEAFKVNKTEYWLFRLVKPIGWTIFGIFLIATIVFGALFFINFFSLASINEFNFNNNTDFLVQINNTFGSKFYELNIYFYGFWAACLGLILTRINTKIWLMFRQVNQYNSLAYNYYHDKNRLIIALVFTLLSAIGLALIFIFAWFFLYWLRDIVNSIFNEYDTLKIGLKGEVDENVANELFNNFLTNSRSILEQINQTTIRNMFGIYIIIAFVGLGIWALSNLIFGLFVFFYEPQEKEFVEPGQWKYLSMVDENFINDKKLKVGKPMTYSDYESFITNGYSGKNGNLRDKQYDIYQKRTQQK